jgi:hypothetical protein
MSREEPTHIIEQQFIHHSAARGHIKHAIDPFHIPLDVE